MSAHDLQQAMSRQKGGWNEVAHDDRFLAGLGLTDGFDPSNGGCARKAVLFNHGGSSGDNGVSGQSCHER